ncbi:MAG TPA: hypothetical protein VGC37_07700 [Friedmanniella sp.]
MNKTPEPGEVARDKFIPAAEELVASLAERVAPFAREAVDTVSPVAHAAAERTVALAHDAYERVAPLTQQAVDAVTPYAQQAVDAVTPYAQQTRDAVAPYAQQAADAVSPYAHQVAEQGRRSGHDLADRLEPALDAARDALSGARDKVTADYLPAVGAAAATAAASASPLVTAATDRGKALVKGVRHEPVVVLPPPKKKRGWLTTLAVVAAAAGATYVVVRKLLGDKGSQWQTARPSTPYVPPTSPQAAAAAETVSDAETDQQTGPSAHDAYRAADGAAEPDQPAEGGDVDDPTDGPTTDATEVVASTTSLYGTVGSADSGAAVDDTDASAIGANSATTDHVASVDEGTDPSSSVSGGSVAGDTVSDEATSPYSEGHVEQALETAEERVYEEPEDAVLVEQDTASGVGPDAHPERYDLPGVYVGVEPPEGYAIKGNERSMKYHLPDSNSYGRTIAEVWFASEEAAERAGFTRAQH